MQRIIDETLKTHAPFFSLLPFYSLSLMRSLRLVVSQKGNPKKT